MPSAEYFARHGFFSRRDAIDASLRADVLAELHRGRTVDGTLWNPVSGDHHSPAVKQRREYLDVAEHLCSVVAAAISALRPEISDAFGVSLAGLQPVKFARYDNGDFFGIHNDRPADPSAPDHLKERRVSVVAFLNEQTDRPDHADDSDEPRYCGGDLIFHGLVAEPPWDRLGYPLEPEPGLLIAFDPTVLHEVTAVTCGQRFTLVTWFV